MQIGHMMKQQDILVRRVKFKNLLPPVIKLVIKRKCNLCFIDLNKATRASKTFH